jgi:hypothetical protein
MERASGSPKRLSRWTLRRAFAAFMVTLVLIVLGFAFVFGGAVEELRSALPIAQVMGASGCLVGTGGMECRSLQNWPIGRG